jgi:hypothetical protein
LPQPVQRRRLVRPRPQVRPPPPPPMIRRRRPPLQPRPQPPMVRPAKPKLIKVKRPVDKYRRVARVGFNRVLGRKKKHRRRH